MSIEPGTAAMEYVTIINACYPEEIVRYYTPGYPDSLLEKIEQFVPQIDSPEEPPDSFIPPACMPPAPNPSQTNSAELLEMITE